MAYMTAPTYSSRQFPTPFELIGDILSNPSAYFHTRVFTFHRFVVRSVFKIFMCNSPSALSPLMRCSLAHCSNVKSKNAGSARALMAIASTQIMYPIVDMNVMLNFSRASHTSGETSSSDCKLLIISVPMRSFQSLRVNTASSTPISEYCALTASQPMSLLSHCISGENMYDACGTSATKISMIFLALTASPVRSNM